MRLVSLINEEETDLTWNITTLSIWSEVESNFAIISGALFFNIITIISQGVFSANFVR